MSNVESKVYFEQIEEWSVPLRDGKVVVGDVEALIMRADKKIPDSDQSYQDRYEIRVDDERLLVRLRSEWKKP